MSAEPTKTTPLFNNSRETPQQLLDDAIGPIRSRLGTLVALALVSALASAFAAFSASQSRAHAAQEAIGVRWEYTTEFHRDDDAANLSAWMNAHGERGWEAYSVRRASTGTRETEMWGTEVMFKRRRVVAE